MFATDIQGYLRRDHQIDSQQVIFADTEYRCVDEEWFFTSFAKSLRNLYDAVGINVGEAESNDCDDFTRGAAWLVQVLHHRTPHHGRKSAAVGEFWYCRNGDPEDEHAVVIGIVDASGRPVFMEPQTQRRVELTEAERRSCTVLRF